MDARLTGKKVEVEVDWTVEGADAEIIDPNADPIEVRVNSAGTASVMATITGCFGNSAIDSCAFVVVE